MVTGYCHFSVIIWCTIICSLHPADNVWGKPEMCEGDGEIMSIAYVSYCT